MNEVMENIPILIYTHTDYIDILNITLSQFSRFAEKTLKYVLINKKKDTNDINIKYIVYDDSKKYTDRLLCGLEEIKKNSDYVLLSHDWAILYDHINQEFMNYAINYIKKNDVDHLRLIHSGVTNYEKIDNFIYNINDNQNLLFSIQPSLWKITSLINLLSNHKNCSYRECENILSNDSIIKKYKIYLFYNNEEKFPNAGHHYSTIYPHFHATRNGKWTYTENKEFIDEIIVKQHKIDLSIRGLY